MELDLQRFYNINRRVVMWVAFFAILYVLRDFFALVFLTFIFGFVMRSVARFLTARTRMPYLFAVIGPYLVALTLLVMLAVTAVPRILDQAAQFSTKVPDLFQDAAKGIKTAASEYGLEPMLARYVNETVESEGEVPGPDGSGTAPPTTQPGQYGEAAIEASPEVNVEDLADKLQEFGLRLLPTLTEETRDQEISDLIGAFMRGMVGGSIEFLLAILLSFLIVLDYEALGKELRVWDKSNVGRFFHEAAGSVFRFSGVVGKAFQCQMLVAVLNAVITCIGMRLLGIEPLLLLTTIVLLFGLIPVLGVFISSVPIILIAFNNDGPGHALLTLGMIVIVHMLEAYVFNPRIYAARFHLNPVIVLIILLIAHKLFGVWGMLLGIPVTHYVLNLAQVPARSRRERTVPAGRTAEATK